MTANGVKFPVDSGCAYFPACRWHRRIGGPNVRRRIVALQQRNRIITVIAADGVEPSVNNSCRYSVAWHRYGGFRHPSVSRWIINLKCCLATASDRAVTIGAIEPA